MPRVIAIAKRVLAGLGLALVLLYAADWARVALAEPDAAYQSLTFYLATPLKTGKDEIFYDQPQIEVCVRAFFPHAGRRPCWYARRQPIHRIS